MATYRHNDVTGSPTASWFSVDTRSSALSSFSSTEASFSNSDGTQTVFIGTGFTQTSGGALIGDVTSMERRDATGAIVFESITDFSYSLASVQSHLPDKSLLGLALDIFSGNDEFYGWDGNLTLPGTPGNDTYFGGEEYDTVSYLYATGPIRVVSDLVSIVTGNASIGSDTLHHVEGIRGTSFDDTFVALPGFSGDYGNSTTYEGGGGNDTIVGSGHTHVKYVSATGRHGGFRDRHGDR